MEQRKVRIGVAALAALSAEIWTPPAGATDYLVPAGTTNTAAKTVSGTDTVTVEAGGKLSVNKKAAIDWNNASTNLKITNSGTIESTKTGGRAIDASGDANNRSLTLENKKDAIIKADDDAVRIGVNPTGGTITVNNAGTIQSTTGQALDFDKAASGAATIKINNTATGTIKADAEDAIRPGQGTLINNYGSIYAGGGTGTKNDGIDFKDSTAGTVNNIGGTISGARHGITLGGSQGTGIVTVNNGASSTITGRNGSGVGSDAGGTVTNMGTIEGAYSGNDSEDGDGDGVDMDYAGTITNSGTIKGTGAGGYDKNGRANNSEGISLGGGTITNSGTISGAKYGIVVNNDSNPDNSRSGVAATTISNEVGGTIEGKDGYAIRLENKLGTAADNDTIINRGTIIGNGTIPDPTAGVTLQNGSVDGGSVGTLDGVTYTGTGSARFIRGDGAAIQMGEGDDVLTNYGTITGNTGRAISLEGGNDTLKLYTGSSITGRIDGGTGTDTINLDKESGGPDGGTLANVINFETLTVKGGTWKLLDDQTYANGATIAAGATLRVGDGATAGSITADIANNGALVFDRTDATSYAGTISGTGSLTKVNTGTLTLSTAHSYTGTTTVSGGVLNIRNAAALGSADGTAATGTTVASGAALELQGGIAVGNEALSLAGYGVSNGGALRSVSGNNSVAGAITLTDDARIASDAGTLTVSGGISGAAGANRDLTLGGAGDGLVSGNIGGNIGYFIKDGTGTWTLTGQTTLGNSIQIDGGTLRLEAGGSLSSASGYIATWNGSSGSATVTGTGSRWTLSSNFVVGDQGTGTLTVADGGSISSLDGYVGAIATGRATVTGTGSRWTASNTLTVGYFGTGTLAVAAGGTVSVGTNGTGTVTVADQAGSTGTLAIGAAPGEAAVAAGTVQAGEVHFGAGTGTLVFNHTGNPDGSAVTFAPMITGQGSLSQLAGTTVLTGANTYAGTTTVSGGTLKLQNGAALGAADGTAANGTTVASGAALELKGGVAVGNEALSLAGFGVSDGGALRSVSGNNSYAGAITLTDDSRINADTGTLTLSGGISGAARTLELGGAGDGLVLGAIAGNIGYFVKDGTGTWTLSGQSTQGAFGIVNGGALRLEAGSSLTLPSGRIGFGSGSSGSVTVTGTGSRWTANSDLKVGYRGTGTLVVAAGGTVSVGTNGAGTLTVADQAGSTGTLAIGAAPGDTAVAAGAVQAGEVHFGSGTGTLVFNHTGNPDSSAFTFAPKITGAGSLSHLAGTTILTGANTYTGGTTISGGTLSAVSAAALGTGGAIITAGGTLDVNGATLGNALTLAGSGVGGAGALTGTGTAAISGAITLAGPTALGGTGTLAISGTIGDGGNGYGLSKVGAGTVILAGANAYTGGTTVTAGTLALSGSGTLGSTTAAAAVIGRTAALDLGGTRQSQATVTLGDGATLRNGALAAAVTSAGGIIERISGSASLTTQTGTTISTGNSYTGNTTVGDGSILRAGGAGGFSAGSAYTLAGSGTLDLAGTANTVGTLASASPAARVTSSAAGPAVLTVAGLGAGTFAGTIQDGGGPVGLTLAGTAALTLTGANSYTGATTIGAGATLRLGDGGASGAIDKSSGVTNNGTLVLDRSDLATFASAIVGAGSLIPAGSGTTVLTGRNTYAGPTTIAAGTLQIDGVLAASEVTVKSGGTLAGSGKIGDPVIEAGGRLAPGSASAIGTLSITGPLTFAAGSVYAVKVTPTANDRTTVTGPVTIQGGTVQVQAGAGTYTPALRYTLLSATGGVSGRFHGLETTSNLAFLTPSLSYDATSVALGFAQTAPIVSAATTPNQGGVAGALNGAGPTVTTTHAPASTQAGSAATPIKASHQTGSIATVTSPLSAPVASSAAPRTSSTQTNVALDGTTTTTIIGSGGTTIVVASPAAQVTTALLNQTASGAVRALNALSGEIQGSAVTVRAQAALAAQDTLLEHLRFGAGLAAGPGAGPGLTGAVDQRFAPGTTLPAGYAALTPDEPAPGLVPVRPLAPRYGVWGQAFGVFGASEATRNTARLTRETGGFMLGAETGPGVLGDGLGSGLDGWRVGVAGGAGVTQFDVTARQSSGRMEGSFGAAYASGTLGPVQVRLGAVYGRDALDTRRMVLFPGFSQAVSGRAGGSALQGFGEVGYRIGMVESYAEPFVGVAALRLHREGFTETGGSSALAAFGRTDLIETATVGIQAQAMVADLFGSAGPLLARGLIGYRRAFGDVVPAALLAFRGGSTAFRTMGAPLARDAAVASVGLDWAVAAGTVVGLSYDGQLGARACDHAAKGSFSYRW